jgi:hypothetical protein
MDCPCRSIVLLTDDVEARKELNKIHDNDPDSDWEIWDVFCFAEMDLCPECEHFKQME